jgi:hypothetical protein
MTSSGFDGQQIRPSIIGPPPSAGQVHVHVEDLYGSKRVSMPFRRRDGTVEMREVSPVIATKERPHGSCLRLGCWR